MGFTLSLTGININEDIKFPKRENLKNFKTCRSLYLDTELSKHVSKTPIHSRDPNPLNVVISYLGATAGASRAEL
jgi:hypothetical protein